MPSEMTTLSRAAEVLGIPVAGLLAEFTEIGAQLYVSEEDIMALFRARLKPVVLVVAPRTGLPPKTPNPPPAVAPKRGTCVAPRPATAAELSQMCSLTALARELQFPGVSFAAKEKGFQRYHAQGKTPKKLLWITQEDANWLRKRCAIPLSDEVALCSLKGYSGNSLRTLRKHGFVFRDLRAPKDKGRRFYLKKSDVARAEAILAR